MVKAGGRAAARRVPLPATAADPQSLVRHPRPTTTPPAHPPARLLQSLIKTLCLEAWLSLQLSWHPLGTESCYLWPSVPVKHSKQVALITDVLCYVCVLLRQRGKAEGEKWVLAARRQTRVAAPQRWGHQLASHGTPRVPVGPARLQGRLWAPTGRRSAR